MSTINYDKCIQLCDQILFEFDAYLIKKDNTRDWTEKDIDIVVKAIKERALRAQAIDDLILRAFMDIAAVSAKNFENIALGVSISNLSGFFFNSIPHYMFLEPLGMEFGKYVETLK